jgi:hypothetical protein
MDMVDSSVGAVWMDSLAKSYALSLQLFVGLTNKLQAWSKTEKKKDNQNLIIP